LATAHSRAPDRSLLGCQCLEGTDLNVAPGTAPPPPLPHAPRPPPRLNVRAGRQGQGCPSPRRQRRSSWPWCKAQGT